MICCLQVFCRTVCRERLNSAACLWHLRFPAHGFRFFSAAFLRELKTVVKESSRIRVLGLVTLHDHNDEAHAVSLCAGHKRIARSTRITGLPAQNSRIVVCIPARNHAMSHDDIRAVRSFLRRREMIGHRSIDGAKIRAIKASLRNQCHVMGCREMLCVVEPARIHEIRVGAAKLLCAPIHLLRKRRNGTRDVLGESVCDFVRGLQHEPVETVTHFDAVSLREFQVDRTRLQIFRRCAREHHSVIL